MLTVTPLKPEFGARIEGADLRRPLSAEEFTVMDATINRYGFIVIPGQDIDDDQQMEFAARFGPVDQTRATVDVQKQRLKYSAMNDISNLDEKGRSWRRMTGGGFSRLATGSGIRIAASRRRRPNTPYCMPAAFRPAGARRNLLIPAAPGRRCRLSCRRNCVTSSATIP